MKELTVFEMEAISGGYTWDFSSASAAFTSLASNAVEALGAGILGSVITACVGAGLGGFQGGSNGGVLGLGLIGNAVGAVAGFILGAIGGAAGAVALGWEGSVEALQSLIESTLNGTFAPW